MPRKNWQKRNKLNRLITVWLGACLLMFSIFMVKTTQATTDGIEIIYPTPPNPIFMESGQKPGDSIIKTVTIRNNYFDNQVLGIKAINLGGNTQLANVLDLKITGSSINFYEVLSNLNNNELAVGQINPDDTNLDIELIFENGAGNQYQNKSMTFDLVFGFIDQGTGTDENNPAVTSPISGGTTTTNQLANLGRTLTNRLGNLSQDLNPTPEPTIEQPATTDGEVKGDETPVAASTKFHLKWWQWLIALLALALIIFFIFWRRRREEEDEDKEIKI